MATYRLGLPSELKRALEYALPRQHGTYSPIVHVTPRDRAGRKCAAYVADHYEVHAFYTTTDCDSLERLEKALGERPGVYVTTRVLRNQGRNEVTNPAWPAAAGLARRGFHGLRPQVLALIRD
ncbi:hypothetical protein GCM10023334_102410 [Nonomuraea thailandensis]